MNIDISQSSQNESEDADLPPAGVEETTSIKKFINEHYIGTTIEEWNDWKWQIRNSITKTENLNRVLGKKENDTIINVPVNHLPFRITPYFVYLLNTLPNDHPLYKTIIPTIYELNHTKEEVEDPLDEQKTSPAKNIVHRYPDRVLFLVTGFCSAYCRFCTRSHMVSKRTDIKVNNAEWEEGFRYIENHPEIRDVIVSGGDPLTLRNDQIEYILKRLRSIEHVEIIRIGTKIPVVLPMRITTDLVGILKKYHPLYMNIHFTHPDEVSVETQRACNMLADAGIPLGSQSVILKGINDQPEIFQTLYRKLLKVRVKPYYLYQMDEILGGGHFKSPVSKGLEIIESLRGYTSGLGVPHYVIDTSGGKIPLLPEYCGGKNGDFLTLRNYKNKTYKYFDPN